MKSSLALFSIFLCSIPAAIAQTQPPFIGMGDSLGEGVQSANAFSISQPRTYLNLVAAQMNAPFQQPLLSTGLWAFIGDVKGRSRLNSSAVPVDLAVSGATLNDVLNTTASATPATETDLVLAPYYGLSQIQIVEQQKPAFVICWAGTDDLIGEVVNYASVNAASATPLPVFTAEYAELLSRLKATGAKVVVGNIPDLTKIAFLFDNDDLTKYTGTNYNLPAGSFTTLPVMILLKLGTLSAGALQNPAYVLSAGQITAIQQQIQEYNAVIKSTAANYGFPMVDAYSLLDAFAANPVTVEGITLSNHYNGGYFSLDGVHPSNFGHAVFANVFIAAANAAYGMNIPPIPGAALLSIFNNDPFVDFGGNGVVHGRPFTGLLETLGPFLGISGGPRHPTATAATAPAHKLDAAEFMRQYRAAKGLNTSAPWTNADVARAVSDMLSLRVH